MDLCVEIEDLLKKKEKNQYIELLHNVTEHYYTAFDWINWSKEMNAMQVAIVF
jgi:hypothetical protein